MPKPIVLAADDDENAQLLLKRAFVKAGVQADVAFVGDGNAAIEYLSAAADSSRDTQRPLPKLLLLDLKMPLKNGFDVLEFLREQPQFKTMPVIVFSSSSDQKDITKAYALGCHSYVVKPADFAKLVELILALDVEFLGGTHGTDLQPGAFNRFVIPSPEQPSGKPRPQTGVVPLTDPQLYRLLVEQVKDYAIFMLNTDGYILSWNEGAQRIKGYHPNEIIGQHFSVFYPAADIESQKPQFELRKAVEMGRYEEEGWRLRKDRSRFWANVVITPLHDAEGKLIGFAKVTRDLTQRKLQEENFQSLLESEERFRLLVDQVKDYAIFILDARGNIASWNQGAKRLKGYTADEVLGKHFSIFYTQEDIVRDHPAHELNIAVRDGRYEEEGWRIRKNGTRFWANVVITSLWDKRGNLTGFAKVTRDLTARKKEEEALRKKNQELESFAHTLSHDLRAPLRSICSFAEILAGDVSQISEEERKSYAQRIFRASKGMDALIHDILKISELSLASFSDAPVPLADVLAECVQMLDADISRSKAKIEISDPLPVLYANRTLLVQMFSNLLSNAIKFSRPDVDPHVHIYVEQVEGGCEIHVKDNGVGIPERYLKSIFNLFERGAAPKGSVGTGIGLAVVKKAVERLGGSIVVKSHEGAGSEFIVTMGCNAPTAALLEKTV